LPQEAPNIGFSQHSTFYEEESMRIARRTLAARGESMRLIPSWRIGVFGVDAAGEKLLPGHEVRLAPTTFDAWLTAQTATAPRG
jgi:hypothetical protein